ncbi:MAG: IS4 family transposase [Chitinophagales bacterium]|nr:IS4 family transposase [Chitinophagales bacterium]
MNASALLNLIPEKELEFISAETKTDHQVKKLTGPTMFRLILFSMLNSNKTSLRIMESFYHSATFKALAGKENSTTKYNSIRDRITTINAEYFEKIFYVLFDKFSDKLEKKNTLIRFDSTMIAVSSKLVDWGMKVGHKTNKKQLKYTVGMKGSFPCSVRIFKDQRFLSEDKTIPEAIFSYKDNKDGIVVFDRGVSSRKAYSKLINDDIQFVTRVNTNIVYKEVGKNKISRKVNSGIKVKQDISVILKDRKQNWMNNPLRIIKATIIESKKDIYFLTNIEDMSADEIAFIYKQRWDIEVLFKFLKQELNLSHLVSRTENGIRVMVYMTLILAILIIAYKKLNKLSGFKIPKLKFANELEAEIIKEIIILCGGQPSKMKHLFNDS